MKKLTKEDAIEKMNDLGSRRIPFLFIIDFLTQSPIVIPLEAIDSTRILYDVQGVSNYASIPVPQPQIISKKYPISFERYAAAFKNVTRNIREGNSYLLNLTFPTRIEINKDLREIFCVSKARYKLWVEDRFVVFSPESFVQIKDYTISSYPMKGTIDASGEHAREIILNDQKEIAEHTTIVDLIRNDLSIIASNVGVESFRYIEQISTNEKKLLQVSSKITYKRTTILKLEHSCSSCCRPALLAERPRKKPWKLFWKVSNMTADITPVCSGSLTVVRWIAAL